MASNVARNIQRRKFGKFCVSQCPESEHPENRPQLDGITPGQRDLKAIDYHPIMKDDQLHYPQHETHPFDTGVTIA